MFCEYCGNKIDEDSCFCENCGNSTAQTVIKKTLYCPNCGNIITDDSSFCEICGTQIIQSRFVETDKITTSVFSIQNLFIQVFKKHSKKERATILKSGIDESDTSTYSKKIQPEDFQPWLYSRIFLCLTLIFLIFEICLLTFDNLKLLPATIITGVLAIPFSILILYFELNIYRDISFFKTLLFFGLGGAISLLFTLLLYSIFPTAETNILRAIITSFIEETAKTVIAIIIITQTKNASLLQGLLIGGAIGCGFSIFESAGYAFEKFEEYSLAEMNSTILIRSILSFGGHTTWAAITGAAFAKNKKININFFMYFAICFVLHALWDWSPLPSVNWLKYIVFCFIPWILIINMIRSFIKDKASIN